MTTILSKLFCFIIFLAIGQSNAYTIGSPGQNSQNTNSSPTYSNGVGYRAPTPAPTQQQQNLPANQSHRDPARCKQINREKDSIDERQRQGYSVSQGEWFRERLRQLSDQFTYFQCSGFD